MNNSQNRHHHRRMIQKAKFIWTVIWGGSTSDEWYTYNIKRMTRTRTRCSCSACGNPRKFFKEITIYERKANLNFDQQLDELDTII